MPAFTEISAPALLRLIGTPDCPVIIDVTTDEDFARDPYLIPTAKRFVYTDPLAILAHLSGRAAVILCQKGKKLSHGVAAYLRAHGADAQVLEGGNMAWAAAGYLRTRAATIPGPVWVTRHRPKIDRIACPWLIRRFVDPAATFLFVPAEDVQAVAEKFNATPFDCDGVFFSHQGTNCTFDTMLAVFDLTDPALATMATVIRAADTDTHDLAPQAAGLLAIAVGMSRLHRDDSAQLDASMPVYDALYRWARDGQNESHTWQGSE